MLKNSPSLKPQILPIFEQYKDYWDEDIQQRVCEYLTMIELSEQNPDSKALVEEALDKMPNFSDNLQTNSILTRRISKLKSEKGFAINQEEVDKNISQANYDSTVSQALSTNNPSALAGINLDSDDFNFHSNKQKKATE